MTFPLPENPLAELVRVAKETGALDERYRVSVALATLPLAPCFCDATDLALMGKHAPDCLREAEWAFRNRVQEAIATVAEPVENSRGRKCPPPLEAGSAGSATAAVAEMDA